MNLLYKLLRAYGIFMVCCILLDLIYTKFDIDKNTVVFGIILFFLWAPFNTFFLYLIHFFKIYHKILNKTMVILESFIVTICILTFTLIRARLDYHVVYYEVQGNIIRNWYVNDNSFFIYSYIIAFLVFVFIGRFHVNKK